ncbi:MAG: M56 family metallopeptidase, partial [Verrucomicrobiales bacterium]
MKRLTDPMILAPVVTLALPVLVDSAFKGALLLAAILIAMRLLRNSSAALRHLVLLSAMAVLLVLPVLSLSLPNWRVLPAWADTQPLERLLSPIVGGGSDPLITYARETSIAANEIPQDIRAVATAPSERSSTNWISLIVWIWLLGAAFFSLRLSLCQWSLWRLARNARSAYDSVPAAMAEDLKRAMGIRRKVQLLIHPGRTMPMTWGIFKTRLLLPEAAEHWETSRLRSVLLHELAHIKRFDSYTQLLVQLTCTLHWFNPLAWISARRIATERERACDDLVLNSGMRASDYAEHLLRIATGYENRAATNISAVAMASSCRLEGRVNDILSRDIDRRSITRRVALGISCGLVLLTLPVAMMRAVADEGTVEEQVGSVEPEADRAEPAGDSARAADTGQPILQRSFIGRAKALRGLDIRGTNGETVRKFFRSPDGKILYVDIGAGKNSDQFFYEDFFVEEKRVAPQPDNLTNLSKAIDGGGFSLKKPVTAGSFYQPSLPVKLDPPGTSTSAN